jgi:thiol-disulfide isomerase/thioredoxin
MTIRTLIAALCTVAAVTSAHAMPEKGDKAPQLLGTTLEGDAVQVDQFRGKVLVVTFWASWCGPCMKELPMLESMQRVAGKEHLQVVAVNIEDRDVFRKIARKLQAFELSVVHDDRKRGSEAYGVHGIPHMVIVGRDGTILKVNRGYNEESLDGILKEINAALASRPKSAASPT